MMIGRKRMWPASIAASTGPIPSSRISLAKVMSRLPLATPTPTAMIAPISDSTLIVVPVSTSIQSTPASAPGIAIDDDERLEPRLKIRGHQQVDQDDREDQAASPSS